MSTAAPRQSIRAYRAARRSCPSCFFRSYSPYVFKENDIVLVQKKSDSTATAILSRPLNPASTINLSRGSIPHSSIIGRPVRGIVKDKAQKSEYRLFQPTLGDYVTLTPRIVTPVYPADANLIVSLLDIHPTPPRPTDDLSHPLEIFEAGTGHGALTLHLARAITGFNPAPPSLPDAASPDFDAQQDAFQQYKRTRRAVVQSLDINATHSKHAQGVVGTFRQGIYAHCVDFHVGTIPGYLEARLEGEEPEPFLEHAILDLPDVHRVLEVVGRALKPNGLAIVFCPSLTQIISCVQTVKDGHLPFVLESTLEIGQGAGVGGRQWDVRAMRARAVVRKEEEKGVQGETKVSETERTATVTETEGTETVAETEATETVAEIAETAKEDVEVEAPKAEEEGWNMVCRPKVGTRVVGGGFLGVFRRLEW